MKPLFIFCYKICSRLFFAVYSFYARLFTLTKLYGNGVIFSNLVSNGVPTIHIERGGRILIGKNFEMNNGRYYNQIGRQQPSIFRVSKNASLVIGDNVGISGSAFVCYRRIVIGNNVKISGNCVIYDTDFHSLNLHHRRHKTTDFEHCVSKTVIIGDDVFIGAHSTILKGVHIGNGSIIGAGSVVRTSIPAGEIWAGNPAVFLKKAPLTADYHADGQPATEVVG